MLEMDTKSDRIQGVLTYAKQNLGVSLSVGRLAHVAHLSPRQFSRAFQAATGRDHMRRAFLRTYGLPPQALRRRARI